MLDYLPLQIAIAIVLDIIIGDPRWLPHPVKVIGISIEFLERVARKSFLSARLAGVFLAGTIVSGTYMATSEVIMLFSRQGLFWELTAGTIIIFFSLSIRSLLKEAKSVQARLESGNIEQARENLSRIVARDTHDLNEQHVMRGCIETTAESSVDGIIAPLFYAFIGGPPLAMAYKAINTLDSMVGYKNEKYIDLGWASAKLDDIANYIPARIAAFILSASSYLCGADLLSSIKIIRRDSQNHHSPNSGYSEAAIAGALGIQLGGPSTYNGIVTQKPFIGDPVKDIVANDINQTIRIVFVAAVLTATCGIAFLLIGSYLSMYQQDFAQTIQELFSTRISYRL